MCVGSQLGTNLLAPLLGEPSCRSRAAHPTGTAPGLPLRGADGPERREEAVWNLLFGLLVGMEGEKGNFKAAGKQRRPTQGAADPGDWMLRGS